MALPVGLPLHRRWPTARRPLGPAVEPLVDGSGLLRSLLEEGALLVDEGYLDAEELYRSAEKFEAAGDRTFDVYRPLILEAGLRSVWGWTQVRWKYAQRASATPPASRPRWTRRVRWLEERGFPVSIRAAAAMAEQAGDEQTPNWVLLDDGAVVGCTTTCTESPEWAFTEEEQAVSALFLAST